MRHIHFATCVEGLLVNFGKCTLRSAHVEMLELANDLVDAASELLVDWARSAVNPFGNRDLKNVSRPGSAIGIFIYVVNRHTSDQSLNVAHGAIEGGNLLGLGNEAPDLNRIMVH